MSNEGVKSHGRHILLDLDAVGEVGRTSSENAGPLMAGCAVDTLKAELSIFAYPLPNSARAIMEEIKKPSLLSQHIASLSKEKFFPLRDDLAEIQKTLQIGFSLSHEKSQEAMSQLEKISRTLDQNFNPLREIQRCLDNSLAPFLELGEKWRETKSALDVLEEAGWLPHESIPVGIIRTSSVDGPMKVNSAIEAYLTENWANISEKFRCRFSRYGLDDESRAAMDEALMAHSLGLYRASCRTIFPEIERVARMRLYEGKRNNITSLEEVRNAIWNASVHELEFDGLFSMKIFEFINEFCYARVREGYPEPRLINRHAVAHGLISYNRMKDSMNTLVAADFMFNAIHVLARHVTPEAPFGASRVK